MNEVFTLHRGSRPLLVSLPHVGTVIPDELRGAYVERALHVEDTDWYLEALYDFVRELGASLLVPRLSRYVIDLNRPPENAPMYPGANNTELCPTRFFTGDPLYRDGAAPNDAEVARRIEHYWRPYHTALRGELARLQAGHGHAVLFGRLPDLNLGTATGASCAPSLRNALAGVLAAHPQFSHVVDGRFKGGHITRHYGHPSQNVHAVQLEMCWCCYMREELPFELDPARVAQVQPVLRALVDTMLNWSAHE
ncbi:MAG: N-formylglutamate deformylase [Betaproteobacteria bacterium]|nr:MAG: N-formylglutamate deformylase [Betaproteobacteria bacterium]